MQRIEIWLRGIIAAAISGGAGGILTGFAAVGIDPQHFNLQAGLGSTMRIAVAAAAINSIIGVAAYLLSSVFFVMGVAHGELSVLYPMVSLGYICTLLWSRLFFKEALTKTKFAGVGLILLGIVFMSLGNR